MDGLLFAQKFPFSDSARNHLKELNVSLNNLPEPVLKKAALLVSRAFSSSTYSLGSSSPSKELLETELMAFPVAKMFVSLMRSPNIVEKFCFFVYKNTFGALVDSSEAKELCLALADDFKLKYSFSEEKGFFVEVPLLEYLKIFFIDNESSLLNKPLNNGKVFLNLNDFARFLAEKSYAKVFDSLPIKKEDIPKEIHSLARSIDSQLVVIDKKNFDLKLVGKIDPSLFPPCMSVLYQEQLAGKKLSYMARLSLASFLFQIGMGKIELSSLFSRSPDFKKHIVDYHINRIFEKNLSAPGCKKMAEYGLKVKECEKECAYKHPARYYFAKLRIKNRLNNSKQNNKSISVPGGQGLVGEKNVA
jgi:DNA primase large subunit